MTDRRSPGAVAAAVAELECRYSLSSVELLELEGSVSRLELIPAFERSRWHALLVVQSRGSLSA